MEFELSSLNSGDKNKGNPDNKEKSEKEDSNRLENNENKSSESNEKEEKDEEEEKEKEDSTKEVEEEQTPTNSPRLAFNRDEHDSDEDDAHLFSLADDVHDEFDFDDYRDMNLQRTTSFEEELLLTDHLTNNHQQVLY